MSNCKVFIMNVLRSCDYFSQPITLRYKKEPQYQSVLGGLLSIILIIVLIVIFFNTLLFTFQKRLISSKVDEFEELDPSSFDIDTSQFTFAISISGINFADNKRYFDILFEQKITNKNNKETIKYPLQFCKKQQWSVHGEQFGQVYDRNQMKNWLCPQSGLIMNVGGKFTSQIFKFWRISINKCKNQTDPSRPCASSQQVNALINETTALSFNFYYINSLLNPSSEQYKGEYLQDKNYFILNSNRLVTANLFISSYQIDTDESIWPIQDSIQQSGVIVQQLAQAIYQQATTPNEQYLKFYIRKSSTSLAIKRNFQKIDDTLSYIGGLFSALISFLFFMNSYNQYSYQYSLASDLFKYKTQQHIDASNFHFLRFIGFFFYESLTKIGIYLPWKSMEQTLQILEESRSQMDIRLLMQKALFAQRTIQILMQKQHLDLLHFQQPKTLQQMQKNRLKYKEYRNKIKNKILEKRNVFGSSEVQNDLDLQLSQNGKQMKYTIQVNDENIISFNSNEKIEPEANGQLFETTLPKQSTPPKLTIQPKLPIRKKQRQKKQSDLIHLAFKQIEKILQGQENQKEQKISENMQENMEYLETQAKNGDKISSKLYENLSPQLKHAYYRNKKKKEHSSRDVISQIPSLQNSQHY